MAKGPQAEGAVIGRYVMRAHGGRIPDINNSRSNLAVFTWLLIKLDLSTMEERHKNGGSHWQLFSEMESYFHTVRNSRKPSKPRRRGIAREAEK